MDPFKLVRDFAAVAPQSIKTQAENGAILQEFLSTLKAQITELNSLLNRLGLCIGLRVEEDRSQTKANIKFVSTTGPNWGKSLGTVVCSNGILTYEKYGSNDVIQKNDIGTSVVNHVADYIRHKKPVPGQMPPAP